MVETKSLERTIKRWKEGIARTPTVECPACKKRTRADSKCQLCGVIWNKEQLELRDKQRSKIINSRRL